MYAGAGQGCLGPRAEGASNLAEHKTTPASGLIHGCISVDKVSLSLSLCLSFLRKAARNVLLSLSGPAAGGISLSCHHQKNPDISRRNALLAPDTCAYCPYRGAVVLG